MIANCLIIYDGTLDLRVIAVFDLFARLDFAHGKAEWRLALFMLGVDLLGGFLCLLLGFVHGDQFQLVRAAMDLCDSLQNRIGVLRRHGVELTDTLLPVEVLNGAQIGVQLVDNAVDLQIGKPGIDLIRRINPEGKRNTLAAIELLQPLINIARIPDLHIFREGRVGQYVNYACFIQRFFLYSFVSFSSCFGFETGGTWLASDVRVSSCASKHLRYSVGSIIMSLIGRSDGA